MLLISQAASAMVCPLYNHCLFTPYHLHARAPVADQPEGQRRTAQALLQADSSLAGLLSDAGLVSGAGQEG
jgi:hypothetical protein